MRRGSRKDLQRSGKRGDRDKVGISGACSWRNTMRCRYSKVVGGVVDSVWWNVVECGGVWWSGCLEVR